MDARLAPLTAQTAGRMHFQAARSVFWELDPALARRVAKAGDAPFEKEVWLSSVLLTFGVCGFSIGFPRSEVPRRARATVLYCPREDAPGAQHMPTAPVSEDAAVVTSLFIDPAVAGTGLEAVLMDAAIMDLLQKGVDAVEAFGWRTDAEEPLPLAEKPQEIGLIDAEVLESAGFEVVRDHPVLPRLRLEMPPAKGLLSAEAVEKLLSGAEAHVS